MERILRPERLECEPNSATAAKEWTHWIRTFENFLAVLTTPGEGEIDKLSVLTNFVSPIIYEAISECTSYAEALEILKGLYLKPTNEIFARHRLATRKQNAGETLDEYLQALKVLSKDCNFKAVTAEQVRNDCIRDSFISGLYSQMIRQRLLENKTLDLQTMFDQARSLETAQKNSESYNYGEPRPNTSPTVSAAVCEDTLGPEPSRLTSANLSAKCYFCGYNKHPRSNCPAREESCRKCGKVGDFARMCRSSSNTNTQRKSTVSALFDNRPYMAAATSSTMSLSRSMTEIKVNGKTANCLVDSGSTDSFIHPSFVKKLKLTLKPAHYQLTWLRLHCHKNLYKRAKL
ncbi:uncharacterized protein LOC117114483 [Anneissia japonica]|uniref:uncharacterized protein LOC117114483 n=1 Tax=Anneissia japonica TaxID=1529436 RepID=UPI00142596B8|nr:uncharacterized protein LOC117114483 [Anneissia japonica]